MRNLKTTRIILWMLLLVNLPSAANAQILTLSLESAIRQAQDSSIVAFGAKYDWQRQHWAYQTYLANRGPQVTFKIEPIYYRQNHYADYQYVSASNINMLTGATGISYTQQIAPLGGYLYADTKAIWSEYLGSMKTEYQISHQMASTPLRVGYRQELVGWNSFKWEKKIEDQQYEVAKRTLTYRLLQIAEQAAAYYFNYVSCKQYYDIYDQNYQTADTLFAIGKRKFELTTVTKEELMSLELEVQNARNQLDLASAQLKNARYSLLSFLHLQDNGQEISFVEPDMPKQFTVNVQHAINEALLHNPEILQYDNDVLSAEKALDEARHRRGFQMGMDISVGMQNNGLNWSQAYKHQKPYTIAEFSISVPLFDGGLAKKRQLQASSALQAAEQQVSEQRRSIEDDVRSVINLLEAQQRIMSESKQSVALSDEAFALIGKRYADGMLDMNTYQFALSRKDQAHQIYISLLSNFWTNYYKLCRLTMYDYLKKEAL